MGKEMILEFVQIDYWHRPTYKDNRGKLFADINCGDGEVDLHTLCFNEMDGEPDIPIIKLKEYKDAEIKLIGHENEPTKGERFNYQMLARLQMDCGYYLGNGNRCTKHLWAGDEQKQIEEMKKLWNSFSEDKKPEWISWEQILAYENEMIQ